MENKSVPRSKVVIALLATFYFLYYAETRDTWHFIDNFNLIIHEAGHSIFFFFGEFFQILAGSLFQILLPGIFVIYFFIRKNYFSSYLLLFWVGQNLINVSVYAADALKMELPLLGGDGSIHDWNFILDHLNLLSHAEKVGQIIFEAGVSVILLAAFLSLMSAFSYLPKWLQEK